MNQEVKQFAALFIAARIASPSGPSLSSSAVQDAIDLAERFVAACDETEKAAEVARLAAAEQQAKQAVEEAAKAELADSVAAFAAAEAKRLQAAVDLKLQKTADAKAAELAAVSKA